MAEEKDSIGEEKTKDSTTEWTRYYDVMQANDLTELEIREGDFYLKLSRSTGAAVHSLVPAVTLPSVVSPVLVGATPTVPLKKHHSVTSPLAGMFYRSPGPNASPFVKEGDKVSSGDVLCIVEAMKVMNEIRSDRSGIIQKIAAENGKPVSAGQELFHIDPLNG